MVLAEFFKSHFSSDVRHHGLGYFNLNCVSYKGTFNNTFSFIVSGSDDYDVSFGYNPQTRSFDLSCSCPYFIEGGNCKHLWAAILEADHLKLIAKLSSNSDSNAKEEPSKKISWHKQLENIQLMLTRTEVDDDDRYYLHSSKAKNPRVGSYVIKLEK